MLAQALSMVEAVFRAETPEDASDLFFHAMQGVGATYLQTRRYRRPVGTLTPDSHWAAGGFIARYSPPEWSSSAAAHYICFDCNPLVGAIRESRTRYRFGDFAPHDDPRYGAYWEALSEAAIGEALCATSYGPNGAITSLHLGFADAGMPDEDARAIQLAGLMLTERLMDFALPDAPPAPALTSRERDCLAFVAEGKTDWEVSRILGVSETTARFHIDNGRRKLGAVNRAHAVARMASWRMI